MRLLVQGMSLMNYLSEHIESGAKKEQMWEKSINFTNHFKEDVWPSEIKQFIINKITAIRDEVIGKKDICDNGWNDYRQEIIEIFNKHLK